MRIKLHRLAVLGHWRGNALGGRRVRVSFHATAATAIVSERGQYPVQTLAHV
jgi:hypothetical protein